MPAAVDIAVVAPVLNERECLPEFHRRIVGVLADLNRSFEIILVDDGSRDDSWARIVALSAADRWVNMGMVGVYIGRIFEEVKARPMYVARETVGFCPDETER